PTITITAPVSVGGGLQVAGNLQLGATQHGGVTVHLVSTDPTRFVLAANATSVGDASGQLDIPVANGTTFVSFVVQALDWGAGSSPATVAINVTAAGFVPASATENYVQPVIQL